MQSTEFAKKLKTTKVTELVGKPDGMAAIAKLHEQANPLT